MIARRSGRWLEDGGRTRLTQASPVVEVRSVSKSFGATRALDQVSLVVSRGSVHAVVGHDGAGKSTLMRILAGVVRPDEGEILVGGARGLLRDPADALSRGISMVHQELSVLPDLTVAENLLLGREPVWFSTVLRRRGLRQQASELLSAIGLTVPPDALCVRSRSGSPRLGPGFTHRK